MGHVVDRWTIPGPAGRRVKGPRHGRGKRWLARWVEPDGRERSRAFASKDAAAAHVAQVDVEVRGGSYVARSDVTVSEYAQTWLARQTHHRDSTAVATARRVHRHLLPVLGRWRLSQVTRGMVQDWVAGLELAPATVHVAYAHTAAIFSSAVDDRLIPSSPCRRIRLPEVPPRVLDPLSPGEVAAIAARVPERLAAMVWLGAGSGLRPGELRSLTVDRVVGGVLRVDRQLVDGSTAARPVWGPLKTPSSYRTVALAPVTVEHLEKHLANVEAGAGGLVFTGGRGAPLRRDRMAELWEAGGGRGRGWHELRHHHASLLIGAGLSPRAVADRLGHADPSETLRTYASLWPSDPGRILAAIEDAHTDL